MNILDSCYLSNGIDIKKHKFLSTPFVKNNINGMLKESQTLKNYLKNNKNISRQDLNRVLFLLAPRIKKALARKDIQDILDNY